MTTGKHILFVASDGLDALEGDALLRRAPHSKSVRVVCAERDAFMPDTAAEIRADTPAVAWDSLESLPRPSLLVAVGNTPVALWASMWAAHRGVPVMHHHAGLRGGGLAPDKAGAALDATADLLSFVARRDQGPARLSQAAARVVGWPALESWARLLPSPGEVESGLSGCLVLLGRATHNEYGRVTKILDACMHACRRFLVYASEDFRSTIVKVGVPLPDGFELRVPSGAEEVARGVAGCRMLVANDERLQALSVAAKRYAVLVGPEPRIKWPAEQGCARWIDMAAPSAAAGMVESWGRAGEPFDIAWGRSPAAEMMDWLRPFVL